MQEWLYFEACYSERRNFMIKLIFYRPWNANQHDLRKQQQKAVSISDTAETADKVPNVILSPHSG
jgi:hypothetical protein